MSLFSFSTVSDEELQSLLDSTPASWNVRLSDGSSASGLALRKQLEREMERLEVKLLASLVRSRTIEIPSNGLGAEDDRVQNSESEVFLEALSELPTHQFEPSPMLEGTAKECVVCMRVYEPGDTLRTLPCIHSFCKGCIDEWLVRHPYCPCCKHPVYRKWIRVCTLPVLSQDFCYSRLGWCSKFTHSRLIVSVPAFSFEISGSNSRGLLRAESVPGWVNSCKLTTNKNDTVSRAIYKCTTFCHI